MILITGSNGMVGSYVETVFTGESLCLTDRQLMDITDYDAVQKTMHRVRPKVVLHLAAATDVDRCEVEPDWAFKTNVIGTQNIVYACQQYDALLIYVSTGGIFNGQKIEPYTEFDQPAPLNVYAKTKWEGEKIIQGLLDKYFIIRAGWMIGGGEKDKKFVGKIVALCRDKEAINVVNDKFGTITYAKDLLITIRKLLQTSFYGLYHVANEGVCSRYDIAMEVKKILKSDVLIHPVSSDHFPLPAIRGRSEAIRNYKLSLMSFDIMRPWQDALKDYLTESLC